MIKDHPYLFCSTDAEQKTVTGVIKKMKKEADKVGFRSDNIKRFLSNLV